MLGSGVFCQADEDHAKQLTINLMASRLSQNLRGAALWFAL